MKTVFHKVIAVAVVMFGVVMPVTCWAQTESNRQAAADTQQKTTQNGRTNLQAALRNDPGPADSSGSNAAPLPKPTGMTESEKYLLAEIERLNNRITELEARLASKTPVNASAEPGSPADTVSPSADSPKVVADASHVPTLAGPTQAQGALEHPTAKPSNKASEPFAFADFTWLNGNARTKEVPLDTKLFTPEIRADIDYIYDFNNPKDDSIGGSSEVFRSKEVQVTQLGVGGDFHYDNVRARLMTQFGMYSFTTPRNDASPARGQWDLDTAYRYVSED